MSVRTLLLFLTLLPVALSSVAGIERFSEVRKGLYRGGQPDGTSDYAYLKSLGVRTIINLRTTETDIQKEREISSTLGLAFRTYPIDGARYPEEAVINRVLDDFTDRKLLPIFVHCHAGKDRTGLVIGLSRIRVERWTPELAHQEMLQFGFEPRLEGLERYFWEHAAH